MPIDLLKLQTFDLTIIDYFNNNDLLTWQSDSDKLNNFDNEVISTKKVKQYKGIYFCFYSSRLDILFKPHYYYNNNLHNANDFKIIDCIKVINEFKSDLKIDLNLLKVINIEFGLNVISPIDIKDLITFLAYQKRNEFRTDTGLPFSKKSYSINKNGTANKYKFFKAYAKGLQFPTYCDIDTFRYEISSKERKYCITELGIYTANDLLTVDVYFKMFEELINGFKEVLILDCITNFGKLKPKEVKKVTEYLNPLTWYKINNQNRNSFAKNKTLYYKLIDKVENHLKNQLEKIIFDKVEFLKEGAYSNIDKGGICTLKSNKQDEFKKSKCKLTGYNISMQKHDSILLSHTGLKYYFETDKKVFEQIKRKYLSKVWFKSDFETQIKEIAHNIRNTKSNQTIKQKRIYKPQQYNLLNEFI